MLTDEQRLQFAQATAFWNGGDHLDEIARMVETEDVAATRDTVENFITQNGTPTGRVKTPVGLLLVWRDIQKAKGLRRGHVFVMDFGDVRAASFDGEV